MGGAKGHILVYFRSFSKFWSTMSPVMMPSETISRWSTSEDVASRLTLMTLCPSSMGSVSRIVTRMRIPLGIKDGVAFRYSLAGFRPAAVSTG